LTSYVNTPQKRGLKITKKHVLNQKRLQLASEQGIPEEHVVLEPLTGRPTAEEWVDPSEWNPEEDIMAEIISVSENVQLTS